MLTRGPEIGEFLVYRLMRSQLADVTDPVGAAFHVEAARAMQVVPLRFVFAVAVEDLHPVVFAVGDINPALRVADDIVRDIELARIAAAFAPGEQQLPVRVEFVHPGIGVAVRDIDLEVRRQRRMGTAIERLAAHERRRPARDADFQQHLAIEGAFADGVVAVVGAIKRVIRPDMQAVRPVEQSLAPGIEQVPSRSNTSIGCSPRLKT